MLEISAVDLQPLLDFLPCPTPEAWLDTAVNHIPLLMIDHANCEKKAAGTAMHLMFKYIDTKTDLLEKMSQLAREEILHFEQVVTMMRARGIAYENLSASSYAQELRKLVRTYEPVRLIDILIMGAFIEARSCERFAALAVRIKETDPELSRYYRYLLKSESRHFEDYLTLAQAVEAQDTNHGIADRVAVFYQKEHELILRKDSEIRFHSGILCG